MSEECSNKKRLKRRHADGVLKMEKALFSFYHTGFVYTGSLNVSRSKPEGMRYISSTAFFEKLLFAG